MMIHEASQTISAAMTTMAWELTARFSYRVAFPCHCLSRYTHRSTTLRRRRPSLEAWHATWAPRALLSLVAPLGDRVRDAALSQSPPVRRVSA